MASTENTEGVTFESTEEEYYFDSTIENTFEYDFMDCIHDTCAESYMACVNDEQCKEWMLEWQDTGSLNPECLQSLNVDASTLEPQIEKLDEEAIEPFATATSDSTTSTTSSTDSTYDTTYEQSSTSSTSSTSTESSYDDYDYDYDYGYDYDYDYDTTTSTSTSTSSTSTTDSTYDDDLFSSTGILGTDIDDESEELECEYTELFWNLYDCGVTNYCYTDQLKLAQSHQYLVQSPSNFRVTANVTGSKSSPNNWTIVIVALSSALGAIVMFEITRRLYKSFLNKAPCGYQCTTLSNSMRYLKNKWEQIRGYKYEKTHDDIDAIEESDDTGVYGIGSSSDKEDKLEIKNTDTLNSLNNDSDISDDVESIFVQSPSNFRVTANVTGSKSSPNNWTIVIVALSSALGAIVMFEITRRLYKSFLNKAPCGYQCTTLSNSMRYLKNKWEQIRGYKYEKTHDDIDAIEESDDTGVYGIGSSSDKEDKLEIKNTDTLNSLNNDSDISDDVELQRTDDDVIDTIDTMDDQFVHETQLKLDQKEEEKEPELVNNDITEITVEAVQEQKES
eukprot:CAMPEP_0201592574 /NCGR_PEP_ID=MMETSP0190_2-20130828/190438_1 /ASSEMBLY_ACC=CAM_ASM_000263 /TAXON_ID=37353 /ORGANISM="Rosalina sp." /LENGTH=560 /DNA_ID=CAMNT_0048051419 /DNA_START=362 /DNA_END=2045 /DNA_ORIENTATION=+